MNDATQHGWVAWFARNPVAANILMAIILVAGIMTAINLRTESFPSLPPNSISIDVAYDSGSAETTKQGITIKLEQALQGLEGIKKISSYSDGGSAQVTVKRTSGYDLDILYRDIKNRIDSISALPSRAERPIVTRATYLENAVSINLYGDADRDTLQETARLLRLHLLQQPGIERIDFSGTKTPEISVQINEEKLQSFGLDLSTIAQRIQAFSLIEPGGIIFGSDGSIVIKADQQKFWQQQFESIIVKQDTQGQRVMLSDIATVVDGYEANGSLSKYNGQPSIGLRVKMYGQSNIMQISDQVKSAVKTFSPRLPQNISVDTWNDQSEWISSRLDLMFSNSIMGIAIVMFMLALFLNVRLAFWVGIGLPVTFAGALMLMGPNFFNLSINDLTTFGLIMALGIVVDDAVVVGESVYSTREKEGASLESTIRGAQRVSVPTVFGVLTTIVAFMALTLVEGEMGQIFAYFAYAAAFCLVFSLIESKLILPAHLAHMSMNTQPPKNPISKGWHYLQDLVSRGLSFFTNRLYKPFITRVLEQRYATVIIMISIFVLVFGMVPSGKIRSVFFPEIPGNYILVELELEADAGYGLLQKQALAIEQAALRIDEELKQELNTEQGPIANLILQSDESSAFVAVELSTAKDRGISVSELALRWQESLGPMEAVRKLKFITSWQGEDDINIQLNSEDSATLNLASLQVQNALAEFGGISAIQNSLKAGQAQIDLSLRPEGLAQGLSIASLAQQIQQSYQGLEIQRFQRGADEIRVKIRYPDQDRRTLDDINLAQIRTPSGSVVPLNSVANISRRYVVNEINRIDRSDVAMVSASVDKKTTSPSSILDSLSANLFVQLKNDFPGLTIVLAGEAQEEAETTGSLKGAFIVALLAIYGLLAIPLKSYIQPLVIMSAIPFGIVGALLGHWLHDAPLSILSMFGVLALSGVVVNDSLLLVSTYNEFKASGRDSRYAMISAGSNRMRAIILTSSTTFAGLIPLITETSEQAQFLIPAAISMGYGILFATLITLILIPALVLISEDVMQLKSRLMPRSKSKHNDDIIAVPAPVATLAPVEV